MDENVRRDEELFSALSKARKKKKRRLIITVIIVLLIIIVGIAITVSVLRRRVDTKFAVEDLDVSSAKVQVGNISTTVSGSGTLTNVDIEQLDIPDGVDIEEVLVSVNDFVEEGQLIATVDSRTVTAAMADVQDSIRELDKELNSAGSDYVDDYISTCLPGRVKKVNAAVGDDVAGIMYNEGSLAILSLDGYMAVDIDAGKVGYGDKVTVIRADGSEISGLVDDIYAGKAVVLVTDNGPMLDEQVTVRSPEGEALGEGALYIHSPLRITGIVGTVNACYIVENQYLYDSGLLFTLTDTQYNNNYHQLLKDRGELEETLRKLLALNQEGGLVAPYSGTICSVEYDETEEETASATTATASVGSASYYSAFFGGGASSEAAQTATASTKSEDDGTVDICTICPDISMKIEIDVDESRILSLELGQSAEVSISSISESETFKGTVTKISRTANTSSSGVTKYTAVVTIDKNAKMLAGMTADVYVRIEGKENALTIPVDALNQTSSTSFVYTTYDKETHEFGGIVEVVTGLSNSSYVEIESGLSEGDTVWYKKPQTDFFSMVGMSSRMRGNDRGGMPSEGMPSGGGMPSVGGMPSGGSRGQMRFGG